MKLFIAELGSDKMLHFYENEDDRNKIVSALAPVEARSAIYRFRRRRLLSPKQMSSAIERLVAEMGHIVQQPIDLIVLEVSGLLIDRHQLRSLDAIQLAGAIIARDKLVARDMRFIASDKELLNVARAEGFDIWDPAA